MNIERHETGPPRMGKAVMHGDTVYLAGIVADSPKGYLVAACFLVMAGADCSNSKAVGALSWTASCGLSKLGREQSARPNSQGMVANTAQERNAVN
jgi:hypothetical protein